ncbi:MAG: endo-1,4-beta-xylanase [bacterium]
MPSLKNVYAGDFYIGCILSYRNIGFPSDPIISGQSQVVTPNGGYLIKFHMNSMTPGNNMKPQYTIDLSGSASAYNAATTSQAKDSIETHPTVRFNGDIIAQLNWAKRQGFTFRGHVLIWHQQTPAAFFRSGYSATGTRLTKTVMIQRMENYLKEVIRLIHEGWPGLLSAMDVVNEAVNDNTGTDRTDSEWYITFGDNSYVMKAFELVRKYTIQYGETQIKLYYNDYNEDNANKANGIVRICTPIFQAGYLDGIGMQGHEANTYPTAEAWINSYNKFNAICNEMSVTEFYVNTGSTNPSAAVLAIQANQHAQLFKCFVERSYFSGRGKIINFTKDGLNDQYTFNTNSSSLWDSNNKCKPAFYAVVNVGMNYNILDSLVTYVDSLKEEQYTTDSWSNLTAALTSAKYAMEQNYSISVSAADALGEAKETLSTAIKGLIKTSEWEARKPIIVEADSGNKGSDYSIIQNSGITYVSIQTNYINLGNPGSSNRIITYNVTLPDSGTYNLFARVRVGAGRYDDDSFFYGNGFGTKSPTNDDDWIMVNGLQTSGFSGPGDVVSEPGGLGEGVWKWVNLSKNVYQGEQGITFVVKKDSLIRTFQIGGRENGLEIDKFALGRVDLFYTVRNLDSVEAGSTELPGKVWAGPPLAYKQTKFVGSAFSSNQAPNFAAYWNQVTPEDAGKWGSVEGTRNVMNWGGLDAAYNFAKANRFPFTFHTLLWGNQQPAWMENLAGAPDEQLQEIKQWFQAVADRYPHVEYVQVVNEPLHDPPTAGSGNYIGALGGTGTTGWDWVLNAFRMARNIFSDSTKLMINDYNIINSSTNTSQYLALIKLLQTEKLVDIIGVQGHAFSTTGPVSTMKSGLDALASTELPIQITEMDIDGPTDDVQLQNYQRIFPALYEHPRVQGITLWGWKPGLWRNAQGAFLIGQNGAERPALQWLREYLETVTITVSVELAEGVPESYRLENNYPNPFNPITQIAYSVPQSSYISLKVYNLLGQEVATLFDGVRQSGKYIATFNGEGLASGVYLYRLTGTPSVSGNLVHAEFRNGQTNNFIGTKRLVLLK